jgi:two-component system sensor histidine kinase UhpB
MSASTTPDSVAPKAGGPMRALFRRLFLINGLLFLVGTLVLALSPATVSSPVLLTEVPVLLVGLTLILAANAMLVRASLSPLGALTSVMERVDLIRSGDRVEHSGNGDMGHLISTFNEMLDRLEADHSASAALALAAQEGERERIARELHDEIGQSLTVALLSLKRVVDRAPEELRDEALVAQGAVRASIEDVRQVAHRLRPGVLADLGLQSALSSLCSEFERSSGVEVTRRVDSVLPELSGDVELVLYRVAQESFTNVARHARAERVELALTATSTALTLLIRDDGRGGPFEEGTGIRGMRERAKLVGAELQLGSNEQGGTEVRLVVPLAGGR